MVTRGECFWVACNRLIIRFFCVYVVREGKRWCQTGVVYAIGVSSFSYFVECMDLWQLVSTHYYIGGHLFTKLVISICLSLRPYSIWRCCCKSTTFAVTSLPAGCQRYLLGFSIASSHFLGGRLISLQLVTHQIICGLFWQFRKKHYLCNRKSEEACLSQEFQGWESGDSATLTYKRSLR